VLQTIYDAGEISRADLARVTHLTRTTVSDVVNSLVEQQLVEEVGRGPVGVGRTPTLLSIVEDARHVIALNITTTELHGARVSLRGGIRRRERMSLAGMDGDAVLEQLGPFIDRLTQADDSRLLGIGISTPGLIDTTHGVIRQAVYFGWQDVPLRDMLQTRYNLPIYVANDGQTAALAEYMFGQGKPAANMVVVKVEQGIGAGIILHGQLFTGDTFGAGEIGHVVVEENGLPCKCGNTGCLETVASVPSIMHRAWLLAQRDSNSPLHLATRDNGARGNGSLSFDAVVQAFRAGDPAVRQIVTAIGRYLGIGVASLIAILGVQRVVITGQVAAFGDTLRNAVREEAHRRVLPALAQKVVIEVIEQNPDTVLLGAAALLLTNELGLSRMSVSG
jgi:predicted NBD/HSP70 family sugar kinase